MGKKELTARQKVEAAVNRGLRGAVGPACSSLQKLLLSQTATSLSWIQFYVLTSREDLEGAAGFPVQLQTSLATIGDAARRPLITSATAFLRGIFDNEAAQEMDAGMAERSVIRAVAKWVNKCWKMVAANDRLNIPGYKCNTASVLVVFDPPVHRVRPFDLRQGDWIPLQKPGDTKPVVDSDITDPESDSEDDYKKDEPKRKIKVGTPPTTRGSSSRQQGSKPTSTSQKASAKATPITSAKVVENKPSSNTEEDSETIEEETSEESAVSRKKVITATPKPTSSSTTATSEEDSSEDDSEIGSEGERITRPTGKGGKGSVKSSRIVTTSKTPTTLTAATATTTKPSSQSTGCSSSSSAKTSTSTSTSTATSSTSKTTAKTPPVTLNIEKCKICKSKLSSETRAECTECQQVVCESCLRKIPAPSAPRKTKRVCSLCAKSKSNCHTKSETSSSEDEP